MDYRAIGLYSGNPATGLDIVFASFAAQAGRWTSALTCSAHFTYPDEWKERLTSAASLTATDFISLHHEFGRYAGQLVNRFIAENQLQYKVAFIAFPGHPVFADSNGQPVWAGNGAGLAAITRLPVISDFHAMDAELGGKFSRMNTLIQKLEGEKNQPDALYYALMGVLRWRQEYNVFAADTGASANTIGGAFWNGDEA